MKKSEISPDAAEPRSGSPRRTGLKFGQVLWDVALFGGVVVGLIVFLHHNGFIGQSGIQPFPY